MSTSEARKKEILRLVADGASLSPRDLSRRLGVSAVTIRKDLKKLAGQGLMVVGRGGARPAFHASIRDRQALMSIEKGRIAKAAAEMIQDGDRVMIVAGTTTALVARHLFGKRDVHLVTTSTLLLPHVRINPAVSVTLAGGEFRPEMEGVVGPVALETIRRFHARTVFVGTDGFSVERGVTAHLAEEAEVARVMADQADQVVLLADASKYGRAGFARIFPLERVRLLITDDRLDDASRARLEEFGMSVRKV